MIAVRTVRALGLALALCLLTGGFAGVAPAQDKKDKTVKSKLKITVPQDDAVLKIEGQDTKPTGMVREFETPELEEGKEYLYSFSVMWEPNNYTKITRTKEISFKAGDDIVVDLTKPDPKNPDKAEIRWVPTPDDIVDEMIKLAEVKDSDIVYEPGPGDGRVLIAAVKKGAKKAVGIEIDSKKAAEATENIKKAKLDSQIKIIEGDALEGRDYSEATVVFLYMGNEFNALLRPILEKQLKPGTRIVSHRFTFGDWKPDETKTITGADGDEYKIHLWVIKGDKKEDKKKEDKKGGKKKSKD